MYKNRLTAELYPAKIYNGAGVPVRAQGLKTRWLRDQNKRVIKRE